MSNSAFSCLVDQRSTSFSATAFYLASSTLFDDDSPHPCWYEDHVAFNTTLTFTTSSSPTGLLPEGFRRMIPTSSVASGRTRSV